MEKFNEIVVVVKRNVIEKIATMGKGLTIMNLVIPKPDIPQGIADNYKAVKIEWTEKLKQQQKLETEKVKKEIELNNAVADAEREKAVQEVDIQKKLLEKEGEKSEKFQEYTLECLI